MFHNLTLFFLLKKIIIFWNRLRFDFLFGCYHFSYKLCDSGTSGLITEILNVEDEDTCQVWAIR